MKQKFISSFVSHIIGSFMCETKELMNFSSIILETFKRDLLENAKENLTPGVVKDLKRCIASVLIDKPYDQVTEEEIKIATGE